MSDGARAGWAGVASVGLALGTSQLLAGVLDDVPSLVTSVGSLVVPFVPPGVEDLVIDLVGTGDKAVLAAGTVVIALGIGAVAGTRGRRRWSSAVALFGAFGALGLVAALLQPIVAAVPTILAVLVSIGVGLGSLRMLLAAAGAPHPDHRGGGVLATSTSAGRRRFLVSLVGVGAAAVVSAYAGRLLLSPRPRATTSDAVLPQPIRAVPDVAPTAAFEDVSGLTPIVVPNDEFYRIDTALSVPVIDASDWTLRITGMVDQELELDYAELLDLSMEESYVTIACVSNEVGDDLVGNARWLGTSLADLLERAGVQEGATQVVGRSIDGWTAGFPTEAAFDGRGAIVAVGMNGEPLPAEHGFPARLIVPGLYGYVSATKWLTEIELTTFDGFDAYWVPRGWAKEGPIKTQSRIDVPRADTRIEPGEMVVAGVAWAPTRGIARVELRVDDGPWEECELTEPLSPDAWVQWRRTVDLADGVHFLAVRATDGTGATQTEEVAPPRPDGASGWHTIRVFT